MASGCRCGAGISPHKRSQLLPDAGQCPFFIGQLLLGRMNGLFLTKSTHLPVGPFAGAGRARPVVFLTGNAWRPVDSANERLVPTIVEQKHESPAMVAITNTLVARKQDIDIQDLD